MAKVPEETGHPERVHAARNDRRRRFHAEPFLVVIGAVGAVLFDHVSDDVVVGFAFHLAETHGADVNAGRPLQAGHLRQHKGGVTALRLRRGDGAVPGPVIMQELVGESAPGRGNGLRSGHITVDQEGHVVGVLAEGFEDVLTAGNHLVVIVRRDVGRKQFRLTGIVLGPAHGVGHQVDGFLQRRERLVALGFIVFNKITALPELIGGLGKGAGAQAQFRLYDGADDETAVSNRPSQDPPQIGNGGCRAVVQPQVFGREIKVVHLGVFDVAHALVVADGQRQEGGDHGPAIDDVAVEQFHRIGDFHQLLGLVDFIDQGIDAAGKVIGSGNIDVGAGR